MVISREWGEGKLSDAENFFIFMNSYKILANRTPLAYKGYRIRNL